MPYERARHAGGGRAAQVCQISARNQGASDLRRTGYRKAD